MGASAWKAVNKTLTVDIGEIEVPREQRDFLKSREQY